MATAHKSSLPGCLNPILIFVHTGECRLIIVYRNRPLYYCASLFFLLVTLATNKVRVLETELSRAAAERDLLRKVALSAEARQHSEEDRAAELEAKSEVRIGCCNA